LPAWEQDYATVAYQWYRGGTAIAGATSTTYQVQGADAGQPVHVTVTLKATGSQSVSEASNTLRIAAIPAGVNPACMTTTVAICTSKETGTLYYLDNGIIQLTTPVVFGSAALPTANGVFAVYMRNPHAISTLYNDAPMLYAMFFNGGDAIHYDPPTPSHGCIHVWDMTNLLWLWNHTPIGTRVVVY